MDEREADSIIQHYQIGYFDARRTQAELKRIGWKADLKSKGTSISYWEIEED